MRSPRAAWPPLAALAALVAAVLALHLALLAGWSGAGLLPLGRAGPGPARPRVQLLAPPGLGPAPVAAGDSVARPPEPLAAPGALPQAEGAARPRRSVAAATATATLPRVTLSTSGPRTSPGAGAGAQGEADETEGKEAGGNAGPAAAQDAGPAPASGEPPPLYPARPPAAAALRYALHYYGRSGEAVLHWRPSGAVYSLQLQGLPTALANGAAALPLPPSRAGARAALRPLIEQASQGQLDANGLAPDRFTDRRRGRGQRAANFRRELGRIEFSGPSTVLPAWPGAQDRLSWWVQLPAIVAAAASVPAEVRLFVVDARGRGELLRFEFLGEVVLPAATAAVTGQAALQHWRHEPTQAEGQRMELWLDPAQGHWPLQLRLSSQRSGERFELRLLAIDPLPP